MKSTIFKWLIATLMIIMLTNCSDSFLSETDPNNLSGKNFWKDEEDALKGLATIYSPVRSQMTGYFGGFSGFQNMNVRGDDVWAIHNDPNTWDIATFQNNSNTDRSDWGSLYTAINRANVFLANIENVAMDESRKTEMKGEVHFLRGFNYFLLVTNYGEVPLRLDAVAKYEDAMVASSSSEKLWLQVEEDLKLAKEYLPIARSASQNGRVTKGAAIAYLGKSYAEQHKYGAAKTELEIIMKAPYSYDLVADYEDNFTPKNEFNEESIFELNYAKFGTGSWGSESPNSTQGMVLAQFIGSPLSQGWFCFLPTAFTVKEFTREQRPEGSDSRFDKRIYTNFFFTYSWYGDPRPDEKWYGKVPAEGEEDLRHSTIDMLEALMGGPLDMGRRLNKAQSSISPRMVVGGIEIPDYESVDDNGVPAFFLPKKYTAFWSELHNADNMDNPIPNDNNYRVMRFAEVLLLHAEASVREGYPDKAAADLKRIRDRAGLDTKTWNGDDELMEEIEHQNLLEFWLEGNRFFFLKRCIGYDGMKNRFVQNKKQGAESFTKKHMFYPVPQSEVNLNVKIEQHPLWR